TAEPGLLPGSPEPSRVCPGALTKVAGEVQPPGQSLTGPAPPRRSVCAPAGAARLPPPTRGTSGGPHGVLSSAPSTAAAAATSLPPVGGAPGGPRPDRITDARSVRLYRRKLRTSLWKEHIRERTE